MSTPHVGTQAATPAPTSPTKRAPTDLQVVRRLWETVEPELLPPNSPNYHRLSLCVVNVLRAFGRAIRAEHGVNAHPQGVALERTIADEMFTAIPLSWETFKTRVSHLVAQYRMDVVCAMSIPEIHEEDEAVDQFAAAMKDRLAQEREEGRGDWSVLSEETLHELLHAEIARGDLVGVATVALMLHDVTGQKQKNAPIAVPQA